MDERAIHAHVTWGLVGAAAITFLALLRIVAPYGRHTRPGFGRAVPQRIAWILMESPAVFAWGAVYLAGAHAFEIGPLVLAALWQLHYVQRVFVFPFLIRSHGKTTPMAVVAAAIGFNLVNAYVNARWVSELGTYPASWLAEPAFLAGAALFLAGFVGNVQADAVLRRLRKPGESGYAVPRGGLYELVSSPNYLCELVEWTGWAVLTWSLAGTAFALYTAANLIPRAIAHHRWYREHFPDYPRARRAIVPFVL